MEMINRRDFVLRISGLVAGGVAGQRLAAQLPGSLKPSPITVYKSSTCGCCAKWVDYVRDNGFEPAVKDEEDMDAIKEHLGVPEGVRSCHTALLGKYLIEGHVPAADMHRLLREQPRVTGLAVPGMPSATPGMAPPGAKITGFEVVAFQLDGTTEILARY
jgi:hypothetical protein